MNRVLRWIEQKVFTGPVLKDYGVIHEEKDGLSTRRTSALLCKKGARLQIALRHSSRSFFGGGVNYSFLPVSEEVISAMTCILRDAAERLQPSDREEQEYI